MGNAEGLQLMPVVHIILIYIDLQSTRTTQNILQQHAVEHEMGSLQAHNEAGPSGTRHSSDHGSETSVSDFSVCNDEKRFRLTPGSQRSWTKGNVSSLG